MNKIYRKIKQLLLGWNDSVTHNIYGEYIELPVDHDLPKILKRHPQYSQNLMRVFLVVSQKYKDFKFIDIGANVGDSIVLVNSIKKVPILAIEGDNSYFNYLQKNTKNMPKVKIMKTYLSDLNEFIYIGVDSKLGTASLVSGKDEKRVKTVTLDKLLKKHLKFLESKLVKVDTDGYDLKILRGAQKYIKKSKPIIFFEYDPHFLSAVEKDCTTIFYMFKKYGYRKMLIYDNYGYFMLSLNMNDNEKINEITSYFSDKNFHKYADIVVFHRNDEDLFEILRKSELDSRANS